MLKISHTLYITFLDLNLSSAGGPHYPLKLVSEKKTRCEWAVRLNCQMSLKRCLNFVSIEIH